VKISVKLSIHYSPAPWKTTTLPGVHAQTVDENLGRPLQKLLSYRCSTTLAFKVLWGFIWEFGEKHGQTCVNRIENGRRRVALWRRALARPRDPPRGVPAASASGPSPRRLHIPRPPRLPGHTHPWVICLPQRAPHRRRWAHRRRKGWCVRISCPEGMVVKAEKFPGPWWKVDLK
jgi:hypothetical protein